MADPPGSPAPARPRHFAAVVLGAVLWGTGGLAGSSLGARSDLDPLMVAAFRLLGGGLLLVVVLALLGRLRRVSWSRAVVGRVVGTGVLAALYQSAYFASVALTSVSVATVVALGSAPVLVASATAVRARRRPSTVTVVALVSALVGLVLLVGVPADAGRDVLGGAALALVAAAAFATMTVVNTRPVAGLDALTLTGVSFSLGGALLAAVAAAAGSFALPTSATAWVLLAYLGAGPTALAYGAYFTGLRTVPATTASLLALLEPLTATLGAVVLRGEPFGALAVVGALLMAAAVVLLRPAQDVPTSAGASPTMDRGPARWSGPRSPRG